MTETVSQQVRIRVVAQDTSLTDENGRVLTVALPVPAEHLDRGPRGARFHVVDYDSGSQVFAPPAEIEIAPVGGDPDAEAGAASDAALAGDPTFRAQNVYAIAAATLSTFEAALGRRLAWGFGRHTLFLVPHASAEANAFYSPQSGAIFFGYIPEGDGEETLASLSHDIVAHETTHAVLDGLRPRFIEAGLPDQPAFHEALGDCVALLSVFSQGDVVEALLGAASGDGRLPPGALTEDALRMGPLLGLAEKFGVAAGGSGALRRSVDLEPSRTIRDDPQFAEAHRRGEILVAAAMRTLLAIWTKRLESLIDEETGADRERVAEEGTKAAEHLLRMLVRGIDYMPPLDLEFEDALDSVLSADEVVAPDDEKHRYRTTLVEQFAAFGIDRPDDRIVDLTKVEPMPAYERMNAAVLRSDRDEAYRFLWENAEVLGIDRGPTTQVDTLRPSVRVGPDGLIVAETIVTYLQSLELSAGEAQELATAAGVEFPLPAGVDAETPLEVWGGGVIVFDQFGRAKLHQRKPLADWERQRRRLEHLATHGLADGAGRIGFTEPAATRDVRFSDLHAAGVEAEEEW